MTELRREGKVRYSDFILPVSHKTPRMYLKFYFYFQYIIIIIKEWSAATTETSGWLCVDTHTQMIYYNHQGFQHEILDPEILNQTKKLRKFCFIQDWLLFFQTRLGAQCWLIYPSITGVPCLCVNIGINVQREKRHLSFLLSFDFTASTPLNSVQFAGWSGFLLLRRDCQTSLNCPPSDPLNSTMPRFGSAWPDPKQLLYIPACVQLCKGPQKLALHGSPCSGRNLGNCKASERNSHCSTAMLIQTLPIQMSSCPSMGNGKIPKDAEPQHSSGCSTANSGTVTPVYDKTPKQ